MKHSIIFVLLISMLSTKAQKPEVSFRFEGIGDNREFSRIYSKPQTILGTRGAFELSHLADNHKVSIGLSHLYEFGSQIDHQKPKLILYYHFEDESNSFHFGSFPRSGLVNFPLAMLTDTLLYYRPMVEGMHGKRTWENGYQYAFVDWTGRQGITIREAFTAATSGEIFIGDFLLQNFMILNHLAHKFPPVANEHINDNLGYSILAGWKTNATGTLTGYVKAGILGSHFRERSVADGYISAHSFVAEAFIRRKKIAAKSILHTGEGHTFISGDPFYRSSNYLRTDLIWNFINHKNVKGRFNLSFHLVNWTDLNQSQQLSVVYVIPAK